MGWIISKHVPKIWKFLKVAQSYNPLCIWSRGENDKKTTACCISRPLGAEVDSSHAPNWCSIGQWFTSTLCHHLFIWQLTFRDTHWEWCVMQLRHRSGMGNPTLVPKHLIVASAAQKAASSYQKCHLAQFLLQFRQFELVKLIDQLPHHGFASRTLFYVYR